MKWILCVITIILNSIAATCQVTDDTAYMSVAKEQFRIELNKKYNPKNISLSDTVNIKYILPIYYIPMSYMDYIGKNSVFANMLNCEPNPKNQIFIVANKKCVWTGYYEKGLAEEMAKINSGKPSLDFINSIGCNLYECFYVQGIENYKVFVNLLQEHPDWKFFIIDGFEDIWAFDNNHNLKHIYQNNKELSIEAGQDFYENLIKKIGIRGVRERVNLKM
ncbi:MAG: hypothetical protein IKP62_12790 [Salinivirgaceae bacterium]|nr:hypothetical protein [Salinivirgaceae bacterium]